MKKASTEPPNIDTRRSATTHGVRRSSSKRSEAGITLDEPEPFSLSNTSTSTANSNNGRADDIITSSNITSSTASKNFLPDDAAEKKPVSNGNAKSSTQAQRKGPLLGSRDGTQNNNNPEQQQQQQPPPQTPQEKPSVVTRFFETCKMIMFHSWVNLLLVFVPVGIIVKGLHVNPGIVFAMNAIAIVPLAGLLSHATESVASKLGDTVGALLNVTFGNAVELIIFMYVSAPLRVIKTRKTREVEKDTITSIKSQIMQFFSHLSPTVRHHDIALAKNEIRIVQASLLGSILANLLLILGMSFFLGGLRYREQIYNSTVTQMSACLLSLSVISLVLPTAFHASFKTLKDADDQTLKISRGTSVILLLVYIIYLLFQLKSHAYMYESTPQHIVDAESAPGPAVGWLETSSSESDSDSDTDSDSSDSSGGTVRQRMKKVLRGGRRRKSSVASVDIEGRPRTRSTSAGTHSTRGSPSRPRLPRFGSSVGSEEAMEDEKPRKHRKYRKRHHKHKKAKKNSRKNLVDVDEPTANERSEATFQNGEPRRVDFAQQDPEAIEGASELPQTQNDRRPLPALRGLSIKNFAPAVFTQPPGSPAIGPAAAGPVPRVRFGIRRTNSLPDRLNQYGANATRPPGALFPAQISRNVVHSSDGTEEKVIPNDHLSRTAAVLLLLFSTGLVAVCAEFLVDSINEVVATSPLGEVFIGLIILPIVGNAAEHVTAITVAMKNKMDLAIGVAVGSSIQIALFITPIVVIIGWALGRDMSLYFTLFETVCLFVSAFIVNFLVLDGRSNYLEGALLCATYVIIALVAFFYPNSDEVNTLGA
ncbi:membrane bound cation transporter [Colletotrichum karsti]|uniref:Membrane bound cation transporter n=1 Tax=Colletotrichum karsti TaxID=1095194 RepID=A0A9P6HT24_9PEZI|nr:membrane bound cation transporter [Colletotrichum karsti]KAF9869629.1 membrane bound cation transporter [Colletotrichum karsti]